MPGSIEGFLLIMLDFALAGGIMWAIYTLRKTSTPKRHKTLAVICLSIAVLLIVLCLLLIPELIVALIGIGVVLVIYYVLLQRSNELWK